MSDRSTSVGKEIANITRVSITHSASSAQGSGEPSSPPPTYARICDSLMLIPDLVTMLERAQTFMIKHPEPLETNETQRVGICLDNRPHGTMTLVIPEDPSPTANASTTTTAEVGSFRAQNSINEDSLEALNLFEVTFKSKEWIRKDRQGRYGAHFLARKGTRAEVVFDSKYPDTWEAVEIRRIDNHFGETLHPVVVTSCLCSIELKREIWGGGVHTQ